MDFSAITAIIPSGLVYAVPLIPIAVYFWLQQTWCTRVSEDSEKKETKFSAKDTAERVLQAAQIEGVKVEQWDNYTETLYDPEKSTVFISAGIHDEKDISALAIALHAIGHAIMDSRAKQLFSIRKTTGLMFSVLFWGTFSVLAFGLMSNSIPVIIAGYAICAACIGLHFFNIYIENYSDKLALDHLGSALTLDDGNISDLKKTLRSIALKW